MQQDHRPPGAVCLVVEVEAVDPGVVPGARRAGCPIGGSHGAAPHVVADGLLPVPTEPSPGTHRVTTAGVRFLTEPRTEPYGQVAVFRDIAGNKWDLIGPAR